MQVVVSVIFFVLGAYGIYWTNKRQFNRRNMAGVEEFSSYGKSVATRGGEKLIRLASWVLAFFGGASLIAHFFSR